MESKLKRLLAGEKNFNIFPFLWVHGESEAQYRENIHAIKRANINAFCVESRPHEQFGKAQWWSDLTFILTEARSLGMRVWILDDKHFPTGYANGAAENAPPALCRQNVYFNKIHAEGSVRLRLSDCMTVRKSEWEKRLELFSKPHWRMFDDDHVVGVSAVLNGALRDLSPYVKEGELIWEAPEACDIYVCFLTRNSGMHRNYINMMDEASCRLLINAVYEPHYAHLREFFEDGTVAGFFSDEPELGNSYLFRQDNDLGCDQDLPWSAALEDALKERFGEGWGAMLPYLWENGLDRFQTAAFRYAYMDLVTNLVERCFSRQIGAWCREHGVSYIGHLIEDNGQHARTGQSLGHYFRGLAGQDMAGIDDIGGQVMPQGEDRVEKTMLAVQNGEFYHYALGKLASSHAAIQPLKRGRAMCEIFGAYGWQEGVKLEKYLLDHFMVRGVNRFVPHAFSCKPFPDPDCPPHFYAYGNDPLFVSFCKLMAYAGRVTELISGGRGVVSAAVVYHAEAEWMGKYMPMEKAGRVLWDAQTDFHYLPSDVFFKPQEYDTCFGEYLSLNGNVYRAVFVPYAQFIPKVLFEGLSRAGKTKVYFLEGFPEGLSDGTPFVPAPAFQVLPLADLRKEAKTLSLSEVHLSPASERVRVLHYCGEEDVFYFFNEGKEAYRGMAEMAIGGPCCRYDALENVLYEADAQFFEGGTRLLLELEPNESCLMVFGDTAGCPLIKKNAPHGAAQELDRFTVTLCTAKEYPSFGTPVKEVPSGFSGFIAYETTFEREGAKEAFLRIDDCFEGCEVFVNGKSAGLKIARPFVWELTPYLRDGENLLRIEAATSLERWAATAVRDCFGNFQGDADAPAGIVGAVTLYRS